MAVHTAVAMSDWLVNGGWYTGYCGHVRRVAFGVPGKNWEVGGVEGDSWILEIDPGSKRSRDVVFNPCCLLPITPSLPPWPSGLVVWKV